MWLSEPLWLSELKNLPTVQETQVQSLGQEDPLEDSMAAHSSILAWRITWTEEPGGLRSMGLQRVRCDWALKHTHSWFTMLCWFQASSTVIQLHIKKKKIHAFSIKVITEYWVEFPVLYSMCLLITYFIFSSVYNTLAWKNPMDGGAWWAAVYGVAQSRTQLRRLSSSSSVYKVKLTVAQSCPTLCDPMDCSLPGSSVRGLLQARILEWVAVLLSRGSSQPRGGTQVSHIAGRFFTSWATREARQRVCVNTKFLINFPTHLSHLVTISLFLKSASLFLLCM